MGRSDARRHISPEPLINVLHNRLEDILALICAGMIIYGTCLPAMGTAPGAAAATSRQDIVQNVLLYIPLGLCLVAAARRHRLRPGRALLVTVAIAVLLSSTVEFTQQFLPGRHPAAHDIVLNTAGALAGAVAALGLRSMWSAQHRKWSDALTRQPIFSSTVLLCAGFCGSALMPFDLDVTPPRQQTVLNPALLTAYTPAQAADVLPPPLRHPRGLSDRALDHAVALLVFVVIGFLSCASLQVEFAFRKIHAGLWSFWMVFMVAATLTFVQMFIPQKGLQVILIPVSLAGAGIGVLAAWTRMLDHPGSRHHVAGWAWVAAVTTLAVIVFRELAPFEFDFDPASIRQSWSRLGWIPAARYLTGGNPLAGSGDALAKFSRWLVFGACLTAALSNSARWSLAGRLRAALCFAVVLGLGIEALQLSCPQRHPDLTHVLLAIAGVLCGTIALQWWRDLLSASGQSFGGGVRQEIALRT